MKILILIWGVFTSFSLRAQEGFESNTWLSAQFNLNLRHTIHTLDGGYRRFDDFVKHPRQVLVRYTLLHQWKESPFWGGAGIAEFEHYRPVNQSWRTEVRPFVQVQFQRNSAKWNIRMRFRNEIRVFVATKDYIDRNRLQFQVQRKLGEYFRGMIGEECFYSIHQPQAWENRIFAGIQLDCSKQWSFLASYLLQHQQSVPGVSQHIVQIGVVKQFLLK